MHRGMTTPQQAAAVTQAAASGFRVLDLSAFRGYETEAVPAGWTVAGNEITKSRGTGDIMTKDQFANFELELEWKIGKAGNSGIFYRATKEYDHIYWSGPEYQLLDDANASDGKNPLTSAASAYALYAPPPGVVKPADEWNTTRIVVKGSHVEHWLNGQKVVEYELWSPDWKAKVAASKFKDWPNYGLAKRGYIGIQGDHNGTLSIRNVRIRELP
jgi:3-keto-disaccharide hydrolase